jgi:hypothetical protein
VLRVFVGTVHSGVSITIGLYLSFVGKDARQHLSAIVAVIYGRLWEFMRDVYVNLMRLRLRNEEVSSKSTSTRADVAFIHSKEMVNKTGAETVPGRPNRGSNNTAAFVDHLPPLPLIPSSRIPPGIPSSVPLGGPNLLGNEASQTLSLLNPGPPARCTSGSDRCCTRSLASIDANRDGEESNALTEGVHSNRELSRLNSHKLTLNQNPCT